MNVMSTETGIEIAVTRVDRIENRKTRMMTTAKPSPSRPSSARLLIEVVIEGAWSVTTVNFVLWPSCLLERRDLVADLLRNRDGVAAAVLVTEIGHGRLAVDPGDAR